MKTLVVEDNDIKFGLIAEFLSEGLLVSVVNRAASYQSGIAALVGERYDLVVLDMTLPVSDLDLSPIGMEFLAFGGQMVLRECARRRISTKVVVVSQYGTFVRDNMEVTFDQLRAEILPKYKNLVLGCVRLDRDSEAWKTEITNLLQNENTNS